MSAGSFYEYVDGKFQYVVGGTPQTKGYYYQESGDGTLSPYYVKDDGHREHIDYFDRNIVDKDGNLHPYNADRIYQSTSASKETSGNIADKGKIGDFDPPKPDTPKAEPKTDENKLPDVKDRRTDRVLPWEHLAPEGSEAVTDGKARDSITNGDYTVKLNSDNELILTDKDGNQLWGYSGADAADLFSSNYEIKVDPDGSIKLIDPKTHEVVRTLRKAGDPKHAKLVLLYHPPAESEKLRIAIDEAQSAMQLQADCFAKGKAALAEDVGDWLHNQGLTDKDNKSSITTSYNEEYLNYDTHVKKHFKDLDEKIRSIALDTAQVNSDAFGKIMDQVNVLDDRLRDVTEKDTEVKSVGTMGYETYRRILPDIEMPLFGLIDKAVTAVDNIVDNAKQANSDNGDKAGKETPEYKAGKDAGYKAGYNAGLAAGQNGGDDSGTTDTTTTPTDWSDSFKDLLTSGEEGGTDDTSGTTTEDTTTGTSGDNSSILSAINSAIDKIQNGSTTSSNNGANNGSTANNSGADSSSNAMQQYMMMQALSGMFNKDKQPQDSDQASADEAYYRRRAAESQQTAQAGTAQPATLTDATSGVVSASPTSPPAVYAPNSMVDMKLPDGSTQKVSSAVAQAVNKELNNPNGSDARSAYAGTPAAGTFPGNQVDSSHLQTGDVVQWDNNRTGLVVVEGGRLEFIVNGQLVPLDPNNPPSGGDYGNFQGFFHPGGTDVSTTQQAAVPATPGAVTAPPTAPAAPPAVSAPAAAT
ncbi:hypothetical protein OG874_22425 [Nocardia sp. NBC_00565]|uniref:hypothetical protein n=1 Tax=Nocardia sp. NBC_00565 TaxID=2975993 RepID=UPI002E81AE25|nr:hypothetical protein [Nocardia sp. NBC_00565]WUC07675.1 hypothetical protein OG874_22425 [Nocardia sp. NBC_00565]